MSLLDNWIPSTRHISTMEKSPYIVRLIVGTATMAVWAGLVWTGKAPVDQFVEALKMILMSVGVYHATLTK